MTEYQKNKAIEIVKDIITQRGYSINEETDEYIKGKKSDNLKIIFFKYFIYKFNVEQLKNLSRKMNIMKENHCICVYINTITATAKRTISTSQEHKIELFTLSELQYNITHHRLVPKHEKISDEESRKFKKKFGTKFPIILNHDPIRRFYNFNRGDIIKITRKNKCISYRIVV